MGKGGIARLAAFVCGIIERAADRVVDIEPVFGDDGARVGQRGRIGHGRSRGDRGSVVARHVGDRERQDLARALTGTRQPAALDARQMFPHGIDLADRRARAQQCAGQFLFLLEADAIRRRDPVRRTAAGQQHQQQIAGHGGGGKLQAIVRASQSGFVGHGMAGLDHPDAPRRHAMTVPRGGDPHEPRRIEFERIEIMRFRSRGHCGGALAGGEADHASLRYRRQMPRQHHAGMGGGNRGIKHRAQQGTSVGHGLTVTTKCRIAVIHPLVAKENPRG